MNMCCQTPAKCDACKKVFTSLCELHSHLSKGVSHAGYLYSVHLSYDGHVIACSRKGICSDEYTRKHNSKQSPDQCLGQPVGTSACPVKGSWLGKEIENVSTKPQQQIIEQLKHVVVCQAADEHTGQVNVENIHINRLEQSLAESVKVAYPLNTAITDKHEGEMVDSRSEEENLAFSMKNPQNSMLADKHKMEMMTPKPYKNNIARPIKVVYPSNTSSAFKNMHKAEHISVLSQTKIVMYQPDGTFAEKRTGDNDVTSKPMDKPLARPTKIVVCRPNVVCKVERKGNDVTPKPEEHRLERPTKIVVYEPNGARTNKRKGDELPSKPVDQPSVRPTNISVYQLSDKHIDKHNRTNESEKHIEDKLQQPMVTVVYPTSVQRSYIQKGTNTSTKQANHNLTLLKETSSISPDQQSSESTRTQECTAHKSQNVITSNSPESISGNIPAHEILEHDFVVYNSEGDSTLKVEKTTLSSSSDDLSSIAFVLTHKPTDGSGRNDKSTAIVKRECSDVNTRNSSVLCGTRTCANMPLSSDITKSNGPLMPEYADDANASRKPIDKKSIKFETLSNTSTQSTVTPVMLIGNQHRRAEQNKDIKQKDAQVRDQRETVVNLSNLTEKRLGESVSVSQEDEDSFHENNISITRQTSDQNHHDRFKSEGNENVSEASDRLEVKCFPNENSNDMEMSVSDVQSCHDEWQVVYNEDYFEDNVSVNQNFNTDLEEIGFENPRNNIDAGTLAETHSAQLNDHSYSIIDVSEPCKENDSNRKAIETSTEMINNEDCVMKSVSENLDRIDEVDLKHHRIGKTTFCVFRKYGFKLIQGQTFCIECRFCLKKLSRYEFVKHIKQIHFRGKKNTTRDRNELLLLAVYLKGNWSPDSRFAKVTLLRGKRYRYCGFSIKPFPELKFKCRGCNKLFCRNDFIKHVIGCYKCHEIDLTEEFYNNLELLKLTIPVFDIKEEKAVKGKQETHKVKADELISCTVCSKKIKVSKMKGHMRYNHSSESMSCEVCGGLYPSRGALYGHQRWVHGNGHFPCSECGKVFASKNKLCRHKCAVHCNPERFRCPVCKKGFKTQQSMDRHVVIHKGERPFSCKVCKTSFKRADHLKEHINTVHDVKVLWVCSATGCDSRYKHKFQLKRHIRAYHTGEIFQCSNCQKKCSTLRLLNIHREKRHSLKEPVKIGESGRTDFKELDYGCDGSIHLKTLFIREQELHSLWTNKENKIFWDVMDKYIEAKSSAPLTAFRKVKKELKGARTLKEITTKFETAILKSKQRNNEDGNKREIEGTEELQPLSDGPRH